MDKNYFITSHCRSAESNLYTKVAELQEDISLKRLDLGVAQLRLSAVQAQVSTFFVSFSYDYLHITQRFRCTFIILFVSEPDMPYYFIHLNAKSVLVFIIQFALFKTRSRELYAIYCNSTNCGK